MTEAGPNKQKDLLLSDEIFFLFRTELVNLYSCLIDFEFIKNLQLTTTEMQS